MTSEARRKQISVHEPVTKQGIYCSCHLESLSQMQKQPRAPHLATHHWLPSWGIRRWLGLSLERTINEASSAGACLAPGGSSIDASLQVGKPL